MGVPNKLKMVILIVCSSLCGEGVLCTDTMKLAAKNRVTLSFDSPFAQNIYKTTLDLSMQTVDDFMTLKQELPITPEISCLDMMAGRVVRLCATAAELVASIKKGDIVLADDIAYMALVFERIIQCYQAVMPYGYVLVYDNLFQTHKQLLHCI